MEAAIKDLLGNDQHFIEAGFASSVRQQIFYEILQGENQIKTFVLYLKIT